MSHRQMTARVRGAGLALLVAMVLGTLTWAEPVGISSSASVCPGHSVADLSSVFGFPGSACPVIGDESDLSFVGVTEGDEAALQRALGLVQKNSRMYVALLFYASWCQFSGTFRPTFSILSKLYPSVPHFAIEESVIRPSVLSKYGVHGFPTLFLLNSTTRARYHGSRTVGSLVAFYDDVTGLKTALLDGISLEGIAHSSEREKDNNVPETCPFSWARSPENLLRQETYLALATAFVVLRLLYLMFPTLLICTKLFWRRYIQNTRLRSLWEHPMAYLNRAIQLLNSPKETCKRSNLQEGAMNAKAWASKSLASVSFGEASSSRAVSVS